jgi:hypothetical protein
LKSACEKLGRPEVTNRPRPLAALYAMPKGEPFCVNPKVNLQQRIRGYEQVAPKGLGLRLPVTAQCVRNDQPASHVVSKVLPRQSSFVHAFPSTHHLSM